MGCASAGVWCRMVTAVRVIWKQGRRQVGLRHVGTGRNSGGVALLVAAAWEFVNAGQGPLPDVSDDR